VIRHVIWILISYCNNCFRYSTFVVIDKFYVKWNFQCISLLKFWVIVCFFWKSFHENLVICVTSKVEVSKDNLIFISNFNPTKGLFWIEIPGIFPNKIVHLIQAETQIKVILVQFRSYIFPQIIISILREKVRFTFCHKIICQIYFLCINRI